MKTMSLVMAVLFSFAHVASGDDGTISEATQACLECHSSMHPGIVEGWKKSRHASVTPGQAISVKGPALKVSSQRIPQELKNSVVGCAECHGLRHDKHKDSFEHNDFNIHVVVSPEDCATCHSVEADQYGRNLMAQAHGNLMNNPVYQLLLQSINGIPELEKKNGGTLSLKPPGPSTNEESCLYCHGTRLRVKGTETRETVHGEMDFPIIEGWPNQGVGRVNLDDSLGSCTSCHTRHEFSIEMARKPYTCKECHDGPDVPAYKVYGASKHGNIYSTEQKNWNFKNVPWTVGKDFTAPTCAVCHMSMLTNSDGEIVSNRTHEVKDRLPWRIFGLIYAHPHPREADTTVIKNRDGLTLPTDFGGVLASEYLVDSKEMNKRREAMQASCKLCHSQSWVDGHWGRLLNTIKESNKSTLTSTELMSRIWKEGMAVDHTKGGNPFDEYIERVWTDTWLFYANSIRFSSAMGGGGDYGAFAEGRYHFTKSLGKLNEYWLERHRKKN